MRTTNLLSSELLLPLDLGWSCPSLLAGDNLWEPASTLCLPSQPSCPHSIISMFMCFAVSVSSFNNQSDAKYRKLCFKAVTFGKSDSSLLKTECVCAYIYLIYILFSSPLRCPISCELHTTCVALFLLFTNP